MEIEREVGDEDEGRPEGMNEFQQHPPHGLHKLTRNGQASCQPSLFLLERKKEEKKGVACDVSQRWWAPRDWYGAVHIGTGPERMGAIVSRAVVVDCTVRAACGVRCAGA